MKPPFYLFGLTKQSRQDDFFVGPQIQALPLYRSTSFKLKEREAQHFCYTKMDIFLVFINHLIWAGWAILTISTCTCACIYTNHGTLQSRLPLQTLISPICGLLKSIRRTWCLCIQSHWCLNLSSAGTLNKIIRYGIFPNVLTIG